MPLVVDASVAAGWMLKDEDNPRAAFALALVRREGAVVPSLWWYEVRNVLVLSERRGRISPSESEVLRRGLSVLRLEVDSAAEEGAIFHFARKHRLTFYDATYLELASRMQIPLATFDAELADAACEEDVPLVDHDPS